MNLKLFFDLIRRPLLFFIIFSIIVLLFNICFPQEAFAMDPYDFIFDSEDMDYDEDVCASLIIARKENYMTSGASTYNNKLDIFRSYYPNGLVPDPNVINDSYDNEKYFDIPLIMIFDESKNIDLSPGIYSGCISINIDGLLIWPERLAFHAEFVKDYTQVISKGSNISSVSLGARFIDRSVFVYIKCQDINKHKYHWTIWERSSMIKYWSYKAFKKRWDSETNMWSNIDDNIRKDIIIEIKDLLGIKRLGRNIRKSIRTEVEELIRNTKPFFTSPS